MNASRCLFAVIFFVLGVHIEGSGQSTAAQTARATNLLTQMSSQSFSAASTQQMMLMPPDRTSKLDGNPYWDEHWGTSSVLLYDNPKPNDGYLTRYDIRRDELEFNINGQVKVAQGKLVKNVVWIDSVTRKSRFLVNARDYKLDGVPLIGFIEILVEGEPALVKKTNLEVLQPNYNVALSTGNQNSRIVKENAFFYTTNNELFEITSKKKIEPLFGNDTEQMNKFIKEERLRTSRQDDLIRIFTQLASLRAKSPK